MLFVVYALDRNTSASERAAHQDGHAAFLKEQQDRILAAGPLLSDDASHPIGSLLIVEAEDLDDVKKLLGQDPLIRADLYETIDVHPLKLQAAGAPA